MKDRMINADDIFYAEVSPGKYAVGIVWIALPRPRNIVLAAFAATGLLSVPTIEDVPRLQRSGGPMIRISDASLRNGVWPIIGRCEDWTISTERIPSFGAVSGWNGQRREVFYNAGLEIVREVDRTEDDDRNLPTDGLFGVKIAETVLARDLVFL